MTVNLLDTRFYAAANPDLAGLNEQQLVDHFQNFGLKEGRSFSPLVDLNYYRSHNFDLVQLDQEGLYNHLSNSGVAEGRRFSSFVDLNFYRLANEDLVSLNNEKLFEQLQNSGVAEGRQFSPWVDLGFYKGANNDLSSLDNASLFNHLQSSGISEGRRTSPFLDLGFYLRNNPDLGIFQGNQRLALEHLESNGIAEGRRFSPLVDLSFYRLANPDLAPLNLSNQALLNRAQTQGIKTGERFSLTYETNFYRSVSPDLQFLGFNNQKLFQHFQISGLNEGRASADSFSVGVYLGNNPDLIAANFNNQQALEHFAVIGSREPRLASTAGFSASQDPADSLNNATNLGVLSNRTGGTLNQSLGNGDRDDIYEFILASSNRLTVTLQSIGGKAQVQLLYDRYLNRLIEEDEIIETGNLGDSGTFSQDLAPGVYYLNVSTAKTDQAFNYNLGLSTTFMPITLSPDPGENLSSAFKLGSLNNPLAINDFIGVSDAADIYQFNLDTDSNISLNIDGLNGSDIVDAQLIFDGNRNGKIETEFISSDSSNANIFLGKKLGVGSYYIRVQPATITQGSAYRLSLSSIPLETSNPRVDPGDTLASSFNLGFLKDSNTLVQFVGTADRSDVYHFILSTGLNPSKNVSFTLDNLTEFAQAQLIFDSNGNNQLDSGDRITDLGRSSAAISSVQNLETGNYFLTISSTNFQSNTNYRLRIDS